MSATRRSKRSPDESGFHPEVEWHADRPLHRRRVYLVLAALVLLTTIASVVLREVEWVDRFGPNLSTEVFGILITLVFVHRFLEQQDRARRLRGSIGALRKASRALTRMADGWGALVKGSLRRMPAERPSSLDTLFTPYVTESLVDLDPSAARGSSDPDHDEQVWVEWAANEVLAAQQTLHDIIVTYGPSLDPAYVEAVDDLVDDPFVQRFARIVSDPKNTRAWRVQLNTARALREAHFDRLLHTIALHNRIAAEAATVRTRRQAPRSGSIGVTLALDYDLKVPTRRDAGWWAQAPAPGTLCTDGRDARAGL
jgi:hypothetical protein